MNFDDAITTCYGGMELQGSLPAGTVEQLKSKIPGAASPATPPGIGESGAVLGSDGPALSAELDSQPVCAWTRFPARRRLLIRIWERYARASQRYGSVMAKDMPNQGPRPTARELARVRFWAMAWNQASCKAQGLMIVRPKKPTLVAIREEEIPW
jgi:hypothetical protein